MIKDWIPCAAIRIDDCFYSDGETVAWEAEIECDQGDAVTAAVFGKTKEDAEQRARLMAASPQLLEAAERALNFITNVESEIGDTLESGDLLRAAIARARGQ